MALTEMEKRRVLDELDKLGKKHTFCPLGKREDKAISGGAGTLTGAAVTQSMLAANASTIATNASLAASAKVLGITALAFPVTAPATIAVAAVGAGVAVTYGVGKLIDEICKNS